jgi:hypothetical protein
MPGERCGQHVRLQGTGGEVALLSPNIWQQHGLLCTFVSGVLSG